MTSGLKRTVLFNDEHVFIALSLAFPETIYLDYSFLVYNFVLAFQLTNQRPLMRSKTCNCLF